MSAQRKAEHLAYLSLGSNIHPEINLPKAVNLLSQYMEVLACSTAWQTPAVGGQGPNFLNAVILIRTDKVPDRLKREALQEVEAKLGRVRSENKYAPRTIDIDILIFDGVILDGEIWNQAHLAIPLMEICRDQIYSKSGESLHEISRKLSNINIIEPRPEILRYELFD